MLSWWKVLFEKKESLGGAALLIASFALLSRLLGLLRDRLLAGTFGAGPELDIYFAAFRIPDLLHGIFVLGGISVVFLPLFSLYAKEGEEEAWKFAANLLHSFLLLFGLVAAVLGLAAPLLISLVAPGFTEEQHQMASSLTRLMLLSPLLFGISSLFSGVAQYFNRFFTYALAPVLYNAGIIGGIVFLAPTMGIWGPALGVVAGAFLHAFIQIPAALLAGFRWQPVLQLQDPAMMRAFRMMIPRTIGAGAYHLNLIVMTALASTLSAGSIAVLTLAENIQHIPVGLVGIPLAIAAFPQLSKAAAEGAGPVFRQLFSKSLLVISAFAIPAALILFLFRDLVVRLILVTGAFDIEDANVTALLLGIFAAGILFQAVIPLLSRAFFALQDTKTPTIIGVASVGLNILLAVSLLRFLPLQIAALPLALVIAGFFQALLLLLFLKRRIAQATV